MHDAQYAHITFMC